MTHGGAPPERGMAQTDKDGHKGFCDCQQERVPALFHWLRRERALASSFAVRP